ncbi:MAG: CopL family metal-binding regulatory protein [Pseudoxanthomonas sp.]
MAASTQSCPSNTWVKLVRQSLKTLDPVQSSRALTSYVEFWGYSTAMSVWPTLLRVVLSVTLVLNGASGAAAAVRMPMSHAMGHTEAVLVVKESPDVSAATDMPCHQTNGAVSEASVAVVDPTPAKSKHLAPDCCKSSSCNCVCVQAAQAPPASAFVTTLLADHSQSVRPLLLGHPSPALPHLNRPPIG